jgi:hypothetical protein
MDEAAQAGGVDVLPEGWISQPGWDSYLVITANGGKSIRVGRRVVSQDVH